MCQPVLEVSVGCVKRGHLLWGLEAEGWVLGQDSGMVWLRDRAGPGLLRGVGWIHAIE